MLLHTLEQLTVGAGTNWFKTGPVYDIITHLYISNWEYVYSGPWLTLTKKENDLSSHCNWMTGDKTHRKTNSCYR